jgi:hypothetical protein
MFFQQRKPSSLRSAASSEAIASEAKVATLRYTPWRQVKLALLHGFKCRQVSQRQPKCRETRHRDHRSPPKALNDLQSTLSLFISYTYTSGFGISQFSPICPPTMSPWPLFLLVLLEKEGRIVSTTCCMNVLSTEEACSAASSEAIHPPLCSAASSEACAAPWLQVKLSPLSCFK